MLNQLLCRAIPALLAGFLGLQAQAQDCPAPLQPPTQEQLQTLQREARDRGFLWSIEKDGRVSYLYGTLHAVKLDWASPGPGVVKALRGANVLALELDPTDPAIVKQLTTTAPADTPAPTLPDALRERLLSRAKSDCLDPAVLDKLAPAMQVATLALASARREGLEVAFGNEVVLASAARALSKPVVSLETPGEQLRAFAPVSTTELVAMVERTLADLDGGAARRITARLATAWASSDADTLNTYGEWCECMDTEDNRAQHQRLLDGRNPNLASRIDTLHTDRGPLFVGVGALHMFGPASLPGLLQARGFTVTRVF